MFTSELSKCVAVNDSNIPLPKKIHYGVRKSKGCAQLPELQRYIDTIIKASNEYDSEDATVSDKEKNSKEKKLGRKTVFKGFDNKIKHEKVNFDFNLNRRKIKNKPKTPFSDAVSNGVEIYNKFLCEFEDPRNWSVDTKRNSSLSLEVENFLKELYPNPYQLASVDERQTVKSGSVINKPKADDLGEGTLPDVDNTKVDTNIELISEKTNNDLVSADIEIKSCERGHTGHNLTRALSLENTCHTSPRTDNDFEEPNTLTLNTYQPSKKQFLGSKSSNSTCDVSSRASSLDSLTEILKKDSHKNFKKIKNLKIKNTVSSTENLNTVNKSKSSTPKTHAVDGNLSDTDIGKLKLLNVSDSDDSTTKILTEKNNSEFDLINDGSSDVCEDILKSSDLNELLQIYDIMNKATESFLLLSARTESKEPELGVTLEDKKFVKFLGSVKEEEEPLMEGEEEEEEELLMEGEEEEEENNKPDSIEKEKNSERECKNSNNVNECSIQETCEKEDRKTSGNSLLNLLLEEEKKQCQFKKGFFEQSLKETEMVSEKEEKVEKASEKEPVILNDSKKKSDDVKSDSDPKIDEVLQFMCECLKKFNVKEKQLNEEEKITILEDRGEIKKTNSDKKFPKEAAANTNSEKSKSMKSPKKNATEKNSTSNSFPKSFPSTKEIRTRYSSILNETKKSMTRARSKRKSDAFVHLERRINQPPPPYGTSVNGTAISAGSLVAHCISYPDSLATTGQNSIQTVESHNELGGYTEETQESPVVSNTGLRIAKSILPLPLKLKKSKTCAYKTLREVLETEEKLLAGEYHLKELSTEATNEEKNKDLVLCSSANQCFSKNAMSLVSSFKRQNSNFVICLNSFPNNLRTAAAVRPKVPITLSMSLTDLRCWNLRPLPCYTKHFLKKISLPSETACFTLKFANLFKLGAIIRLSKTVVVYAASLVCMKIIIGVAKQQEEFSMKASRYLIEKLQITQSVGSNEPETKEASTFTQTTDEFNLASPSETGIDIKTEVKPINAVIEAIEEAEEKVSFFENLNKNSDPMGSCSESEISKNETSDNELEKENNKKKVHSLLLRTFNLQQKLHTYLHKMTYVKPTPLTCPLVRQEPFLDFGIFVQEKTDSNGYATEFDANPKSSLPLFNWYMQPPMTCTNSKMDTSLTVKIQTTDQGTTYNPPSEETNGECENINERSLKREEEEEVENDEDDKSSVYSFKSSNDFSEINDSPYETKDFPNRVANGEFIKNIFNKIDSFKQTFEEKNLENQKEHKSGTLLAETDNTKEEKENRLVKYDPKMPAKVLKTVFKGKKSLTELTIGLKDVPMTKVSNISVEKTKFSPNHTKISICISKEKPDERTQHKNTNNDVLHDEFSSYYFDSVRPSLSTCQTECSRLEDDISKSSETPNEGSEDEEDDYKSVGSTADNSDTEPNNENSQPKEQKRKETAEEPPPKNFTKHRFDFYRKMDLTMENNKPKQRSLSSTLCRYKELEPLKQSLTEMQIRMRGIQRDAILNSTDYYERALKLAKMSAGYCQSCGTRAVIPNDTFGYYKTLLHRRYTHHHHHRRNKQFRTAITPNSSFYSFRSSVAELGDRFCDLDIKHSSSYLLNRKGHSNRTVLRSSLHDMPILFEKI